MGEDETAPGPYRLQVRHQGVSDLITNGFLEREPTGEAVDELRNRPEPEKLASRGKGDGPETRRGHEMVGTHRRDGDVPKGDDLGLARRDHDHIRCEDRLDIELIAFAKVICICLRDSLGRSAKLGLSRRIAPQRTEEALDCESSLDSVDGHGGVS
jgi:hypothetical protein